MEAWWFTVAGHGILVVGYVWIAAILFIGNTKSRQWHLNPLATATFLIFATCAAGHGIHVYHAFEGALGFETASITASRSAMGDPTLLVWSLATAMVAVWYLTLRRRLHLVSVGAPLCEDMEQREADARALREPIDASIAQAEAHLGAGDEEAALAAIDEAMEISQQTITTLIGDDRRLKIKAGDLRRRSAA